MSEPLDQAAGAPARTPAYVAYKTLLTLVEDLQTHGLPPRIDRSVLKRFSGGVGAQLQMALRSLGLVDDQNQPTQPLENLVKGYGQPEFKGTMKEVLRVAYPFL